MDKRHAHTDCHLPTTRVDGMGSSHSVSFDGSISRSPNEGPVLVITTEALKQLNSQISETKREEVRD